jgi:pimeloyl-ACP methyl ester carboxylesterase
MGLVADPVPTATPPPAPDATRPEPPGVVAPTASGRIERNGIGIQWDAYGAGELTILFLPSWAIVHSRLWKFQVPYFSRSYRVVTFDGRGNGRSDRPTTAAAYADAEFAADALAVLDATGTRRAVIVSLSAGAAWALLLAARHPERVAGAIFLGPALALAPPDPGRAATRETFDDELARYEGWDKYNRHFWRREYGDFLEFFFGECLSEPHSTKPIEDGIRWGRGTDGETLVLTHDAPKIGGRDEVMALARSVGCPVLVIHGTDDHIVGHRHGAALAELTGGSLLSFAQSGHIVCARDPIRTNLAIREFIDALPGRET